MEIRKETKTQTEEKLNIQREWVAQRNPAGFNKKKNCFSEEKQNKKKTMTDRQQEGKKLD